MSDLRKAVGRLVSLVRTAVINRVDDSQDVQEVQVTSLEDEVDDAVPMYQPLGVSFTPEAGAETLTVSVGSDAANKIALAAQARGRRPTDAEEGCGGVYRPLDGTWALYVAEDGTLHLAERDAADFVALASKVDTEIARLWTVLTTWTVVAQDGGAALQTAAIAAEEAVQPVGSAVVKCP